MISALSKWKQENHDFQTSLHDIMRPCLKILKEDGLES